jgi:hypothetical protein
MGKMRQIYFFQLDVLCFSLHLLNFGCYRLIKNLKNGQHYQIFQPLKPNLSDVVVKTWTFLLTLVKNIFISETTIDSQGPSM